MLSYYLYQFDYKFNFLYLEAIASNKGKYDVNDDDL